MGQAAWHLPVLIEDRYELSRFKDGTDIRAFFFSFAGGETNGNQMKWDPVGNSAWVDRMEGFGKSERSTQQDRIQSRQGRKDINPTSGLITNSSTDGDL